MKKTILKKLALITAIIFSGSYAYAEQGDNNHEKISHLAKAVVNKERMLWEFVNINNKGSFNDFVFKMTENLKVLQRYVEGLTRSHCNALSKEVDELMDYALQQFNILCNIFKKYNGKKDQALNFAGEIKKEFDIEKTFSILISKLEILKRKATNACDKLLAEEIAALIKIIEDKKAKWNKKGNPELFAGIAHRMKC